MTTLILHVGPGKCGSSSIQRALLDRAGPSPGVVRMPPPPLIRLLEAETVPDAARAQLAAMVADVLARAPVCIVSHEVLFQRRDALSNVLEILRPLVDRVRIVGYSRRQSAFLPSAYGQWWFRSPERTAEVAGIVREAGLVAEHFTGLERCFIAAVRTDMHAARQLSGHAILDWRASYADIERRAAPWEAEVSVGYIPRPGYEFSLLADFYRRCGAPFEGVRPQETPPANPQYDDDMIEAVNLAVSHGYAVPRPNEHSLFFDDVADVPQREVPAAETAFLDLLKAYVDTFHWDANRALCATYGLEADYFRPDRFVGRDEAEAAIADEAARRRRDPDIVARRNAAVAARLAAMTYRRHLDAAAGDPGGSRGGEPR